MDPKKPIVSCMFNGYVSFLPKEKKIVFAGKMKKIAYDNGLWPSKEPLYINRCITGIKIPWGVNRKKCPE